MPYESSTLLVTDDETTARKVAAALESGSRLGPLVVCERISDLAGRLRKTRCPVALVDIDPEPMRMLSEIAALVADCPDTKFVVLSSSLKTDLILEAMQTGARQFLCKDAINGELVPTLHRLIEQGSPRQGAGSGSAITVLSAGGGSGATTIAVNLANDLHLAGATNVLLVDMDLSYGAIATYLGLQGNYGLADVLSHGNAPDAQLVRSCAMTFTQGLHVLLSPASVSTHTTRMLEYGNLANAIRACREAYGFTVIDAPHIPPELAVDLALQSQTVLIVLQMTVKDIHYARELRSALNRAGVPPSQIMLVVNRYLKRNPMISFKDCRKALGEENLEIVRNDFRSAVRGINYGKPLAEAAPMSALRKDVRRLAEKLAQIHAHLSVEEAKR